jgi:hypothetical protein
MRLTTMKIDRREYVLVPKAEYQELRRRPKAAKKVGKSSGLPEVEQYTDKRIAEFLLTNTTDAKDYARACKLVRKMGLDPAKIDHDRPPGVE